MKSNKLLVSIAFTLAMFVGVSSVSAANLTKDEIVNQLKNSETYNACPTQGATCDITSNAGSILITTNTAVGNTTTTLAYRDDSIMYTFTGNKETDSLIAVIDTGWIQEVLFIILKANGYAVNSSADVWTQIDQNNPSKYNYVDNGLELQIFMADITLGTDTNQYLLIDNFRVNVNDVRLNAGQTQNPVQSDDTTPESSQNQNTGQSQNPAQNQTLKDTTDSSGGGKVDNPKTGVFDNILILVAGVLISILTIMFSNKNETFKNF